MMKACFFRCLFFAFALMATGNVFAECDNAYYAPDDANNETALSRPSQEFAATLRKAKAGIAMEQRSLAVSYETGYLVSPCQDKAGYWYRKAALGGDEVAKRWVGKHENFERLDSTPECARGSCGSPGGGVSLASLVVSPDGHYRASVTINGITEVGLIDSGATLLTMSDETAKRFGIDPKSGKSGTSLTAGGVISDMRLTLPEVIVSGIKLQNVGVSIGAKIPMLIGNSVLKQLKVQMGSGLMTMTK